MKAWYRSKTLWFNVAAIAFEAAAQTMYELKAVLPENYQPYFLFSVVMGNLLLRAITTERLTLRGEK